MKPNIEAKNIRWLILTILHEKRRAGKAESGGWLKLEVLRKLLDMQGHALSVDELKDYCVYLNDSEIACIEIQRDGHSAPYTYKYRITAKGVRAVDYEEIVPGVGIYSAKEDE